MYQPTLNATSPTSHPQEKLQKCLEPLEQKLQEITRCKSSEEKKPGELKVKADDSIWAALQAVNHTLTTHSLIHQFWFIQKMLFSQKQWYFIRLLCHYTLYLNYLSWFKYWREGCRKWRTDSILRVASWGSSRPLVSFFLVKQGESRDRSFLERLRREEFGKVHWGERKKKLTKELPELPSDFRTTFS